MTQTDPKHEALAANDSVFGSVVAVALRFLIPVTLVGGLVAALFIAWMLTL